MELVAGASSSTARTPRDDHSDSPRDECRARGAWRALTLHVVGWASGSVDPGLCWYTEEQEEQEEQEDNP